MSGWTNRYQEILEQAVADKQKRVFLFEGSDDVQAYRAVLDNHFGDSRWNLRWALDYAGSKSFVCKMLQQQPEWIGLVDRDEWDNRTVSSHMNAHPNLRTLPRYCMESYLIVPKEIWAVLPAHYQAKFPKGYESFQAMILRDLAKWVRHGVLWSVINPLQDELISTGFKDYLLHFDNAQDDQVIQSKLKEWGTLFHPQALFETFQNRLQEVNQLSEFEQLTRWVHGKKFWKSRVLPVLIRFLGRRTGDDKPYDVELWEHLGVPEDMRSILELITLEE